MNPIERQILTNQFKILAFLDSDNKESHLHNASITEQGISGLYSEVLPGYDGISPEVCQETHQILTMFRAIENGVALLDPDEKKELNLKKLEFRGFDANNDDHYYFTQFLVDESNRYMELKGKYLNSHNSATIRNYRKMLTVYDSIKETKTLGAFNKKELELFINSLN